MISIYYMNIITTIKIYIGFSCEKQIIENKCNGNLDVYKIV